MAGRWLGFGLALALGVAVAQGGGGVLTRLDSHGDPQSGLVVCKRAQAFNISSPVGATICGFDLPLAPGTYRVDVFATLGGGTYAPHMTNPSAWAWLGSNNAVVALTSGSLPMSTAYPRCLTPIVIPGMAVPIPAGTLRGFYIATARIDTAPILGPAGFAMQFGQGVGPGSDNVITLSSSQSATYTFASTDGLATFIGAVHYRPGTQVPCNLPRAAYEYQLNQPAAAMRLNDFTEAAYCLPISIRTPRLEESALTLRSTRVGSPWDLAITLGSAPVPLSGAGFATANHQSVNLDLAAPQLWFALGGPSANLSTSSFPPTEIVVPFAMAVPATLSSQLVVLDPTHPDGFALSHAATAEAYACPSLTDFEGLANPGFTNDLLTQAGLPWRLRQSGFVVFNTLLVPGAASGQGYAVAGSQVPEILPFQMVTCPIDSTLAPLGQLSFSLYRENAPTGSLSVQLVGASGAVTSTLATYNGSTTLGTGWTTEILSFTPLAPYSRILFRADTQPGDAIAIDNLSIQ